jgi:RNA polymerase sigma-70 factor (ECF subfamily)
MPIDKGFSIEISHEVIRQAKEDNLDAFEEIYNTYSKACYLLAWRVCGQEAMAQDIVHDVFIKVMHKIKDFRSDGYFVGWIRQIVVRETINRVKSESRLHLITNEELCNEKCTDLFNYNWLESYRDIESLTCHLSATSKAVLLLHEVEGYNHKEIANFFDKSESFSKVTLSRAYAVLKKIVSKQESINALN